MKIISNRKIRTRSEIIETIINTPKLHQYGNELIDVKINNLLNSFGWLYKGSWSYFINHKISDYQLILLNILVDSILNENN